jgi:hypothetical protein
MTKPLEKRAFGGFRLDKGLSIDVLRHRESPLPPSPGLPSGTQPATRAQKADEIRNC